MRFACALGSLFIVALSASAQAQNGGVHLTQGDAIFDYGLPLGLPTVSNGASGNVSTDFQLGGAYMAPNTNWNFTGNWFYRIQGDDRERQFHSADQQTLTGSNEVEYAFPDIHTGGAQNTTVTDASGLMAFHVFDTGVDTARLNTEACIINSGDTPIAYTTYAIFDINVLGTFLGDTYGPMTLGSTLIVSATDGFGTAAMIGPGATSGGVGNFNSTMGQMFDGDVDNFPNMNPLGFGPTVDAVAFMQFSNQIAAPHSSNCSGISIEIGIAVPEPSSLSLLLVGIAFIKRRRRQ